jgi:hypothetical protein
MTRSASFLRGPSPCGFARFCKSPKRRAKQESATESPITRSALDVIAIDNEMATLARRVYVDLGGAAFPVHRAGPVVWCASTMASSNKP